MGASTYFCNKLCLQRLLAQSTCHCVVVCSRSTCYYLGHYSQVSQQQRTCLFLFQGCDDSFLSAFPPFVFEYTGGIPRSILWTYTIVHAWTCIRSKRDGTRAKKLTVEDIPQALKHVFDYLYHRHQVCCYSVTAQHAM